MYRISADRDLFAEEISQLAFNLGSLEFYEILLVATAIFLASRRIWYDSTLLVGLENLFVFVPFILVSQVALISRRAVWVVCAVTAILAILRIGSLKRYFKELNLPTRALLLGFVVLMINIGLLVTYRIVGETKMGWKPDSGRDYVINQFTWLVLFPAGLALANFLPHAGEHGSLAPQRRWLPAGLLAAGRTVLAVDCGDRRSSVLPELRVQFRIPHRNARAGILDAGVDGIPARAGDIRFAERDSAMRHGDCAHRHHFPGGFGERQPHLLCPCATQYRDLRRDVFAGPPQFRVALAFRFGRAVGLRITRRVDSRRHAGPGPRALHRRMRRSLFNVLHNEVAEPENRAFGFDCGCAGGANFIFRIRRSRLLGCTRRTGISASSQPAVVG